MAAAQNSAIFHFRAHGRSRHAQVPVVLSPVPQAEIVNAESAIDAPAAGEAAPQIAAETAATQDATSVDAALTAKIVKQIEVCCVMRMGAP